MSDIPSWVAPTLTVCSFVACVVLILPLVTKVRSRNLPITTILVSVLLYTLFQGINALLWPTEAHLDGWQGQGLCDVEVKLAVAFDVAIPGGLLCLFRRLSRSMKTSRLGIKPSKQEQRRTLVFEIFFCMVLPILSMPCSYIVQPGRYFLATIKGCVPVFDSTALSYALLLSWPIVLSFIGLIYWSLATVRMIRHFNHLSQVFADTAHTPYTRVEIIKIYVFGFLLYFVRTPFMLYELFFRNAAFLLLSFSWSRIHSFNWSEKIWIFHNTPQLLIATRGVSVFSTVIFAIIAAYCFGSVREVKEELRLWKKSVQGAWEKMRLKRNRRTVSALPF